MDESASDESPYILRVFAKPSLFQTQETHPLITISLPSILIHTTNVNHIFITTATSLKMRVSKQKNLPTQDSQARSRVIIYDSMDPICKMAWMTEDESNFPFFLLLLPFWLSEKPEETFTNSPISRTNHLESSSLANGTKASHLSKGRSWAAYRAHICSSRSQGQFGTKAKEQISFRVPQGRARFGKPAAFITRIGGYVSFGRVM